MSLSDINWSAVKAMNGGTLKAQVFSILQDASSYIQTGTPDDPALLAVVPRLADLIAEKPELGSYREIYSSLARAVGLWNYIDKDSADKRDLYIAEAAAIPELGISLHREQVVALRALLEGRNLILSAPTSFGKSVLVDALLLSGRFSRVAVVLPTIALLDEFRRRLVRRFGREFDILMHHSELPKRKKVVFLGTQERLINREDIGKLDLVVVDEFYKLDPSRRDERSIILNAAAYKLLTRSKQFFFLGPNIDNVSVGSESRWVFSFLKTRFSTVAVDTYDLRAEKNKEEKLKAEAYNTTNWPALVFVSSPDRANALAASLAKDSRHVGDTEELATWMVENYGKRWALSDAIAAGIGVHHARIPRALASRLVKAFNDGKLPILLCTSTLIEGVNTAAKSVLIYDKQIKRADYDFFTFSNIKGRAGRLGQHHVGNVYLFHAPPGLDGVDIDAPLFGDWEDAPDEYVVHLDDEDTTPAIDERVHDLSLRSGLSAAELRRYSSMGLETLVEMKGLVEARLARGVSLAWVNRPSYAEIEAVCEVISHIKKPQDFGCGSYKQMAVYINTLRQSRSMKDFFFWHSGGYKGEESKIDNVFKFLRSVEYSLPEYFSVIELLVSKANGLADYGLFVAEMPRWFRHPALKMLDEQGIPIQISERFVRRGDTLQSLSRRLRTTARSGDDRLSRFERAWILEALPEAG